MSNDPLNFITADTFFEVVNNPSTRSQWKGPRSVKSVTTDPPADVKIKESWYGVNIFFDDQTCAVVQYVRPTVWRIRYDPTVTNKDEYTDINKRTIIMNHMSELTNHLDTHFGVVWKAELKKEAGYWVFATKVDKITHQPEDRDRLYNSGEAMRIIIHESPFRLQATRKLHSIKDPYPTPEEAKATAVPQDRTIWQTSENTFRYKLHDKHDMLKETILEVIKAGHAGQGKYIGFGEQGGASFLKKTCYMNYFNADNMQYKQVYNRGPLDPREPLYHSDPFYLNVNHNPEHMNVTGAFIDNYSQIAVDFGKSNSRYLKIGTRFGAMDYYCFSADTVPLVIQHFTALIGRPRLKPRYILGNHQACYGYEDDAAISAVWRYYRDYKIPLDGIHIDVDFQKQFRTFTIDPNFFGKVRPKVWDGPKAMFDALRNDGIKCSTNITPVVSLNDIDNDPNYPNGYTTFREARDRKYFVRDERYKDHENDNHWGVRYLGYGGGNRYDIDPNLRDKRPEFRPPSYGDDGKDSYDFGAVWNNHDAFYHGGVSYGYYNGTPGHYPDLNVKETRDWWGTQYKYLFEQGLEFVWQDMTTPAIGEAYGDMKGFPSRLLVSSDHGGLSANPNAVKVAAKKPACELWALYSYNLHKATSHGLDRLHEIVPTRQNKRNFILGRGSFTGMYRFAGLWTGDNASTWDFWKITVSQVLSVGLNGVSIAGSDCGGFEPVNDAEKWCSPELLIRWYAGSVLLPWLRNHYVKKKYYDQPEDTRRKFFQEPYAYEIHVKDKGDDYPLKWMYYSVPAIIRYYIELRYSLVQVLYDAMFSNVITGLPITQSMSITDPQDTSFYNDSQEFLDNQYVVGHNILVAPIMDSREAIRSAQNNPYADENRDVYLPVGYDWYPFNLNPYESDHRALMGAAEGGSIINYRANIVAHWDYEHFPYVTPMYIREGAIIPQLNVTQFVGDIRGGPNHMRFNVYPGKEGRRYFYRTYLDDGASRDSAPRHLVYKLDKKGPNQSRKAASAHARTVDPKVLKGGVDLLYVDGEARGKYRELRLKNETGANFKRTVTITRIDHKDDPNYADAPDADYSPERELGKSYSVVFWYPPELQRSVDDLKATITVKVGGKPVEIEPVKRENHRDKRFVKITVEEIPGKSDEVVVVVE